MVDIISHLASLILPSINEFLSPAKDQHGFRPNHSTTSALLHLTTDIEIGFNQRKPPHRTVCVDIDLTAAFDTVSHDIGLLISKITGSSLPLAITRWLSCYLRRQAAEVSGRARESSAPASLKDPSCYLLCSTITYLICQGQLPRSRGFATTSESGLLDQISHSWSP